MRRLKIGDTFIIKGTVTNVYCNSFRFKTPNGGTVDYWLASNHVEEITTPWKPQVGEQVDVLGKFKSILNTYTVLAIQDQDPNPARQWAVVAFGSDIPQVVLLRDVVQRGVDT